MRSFNLMQRALAAIVILAASAIFAQAPKWQVELDEPAKTYEFVGEGKILFLATGKLAWGFDAASGAKKWELTVEDYHKKGPHQLVGDDYIVANDDKVQSYSAITGKLNWEKEYDDIDQDDFMEISFLNTTAVLRYSNIHIGVDLKTGAELWRQEISYNQDALVKAGYNYSIIKSRDKMIVFTGDETIDLYDVRTGKMLARFEDCEPNYDVAKKGKDWDYRDSTDHYQLYLLDNGKAVVIDLDKNKLVASHEMAIDEDRVFFVETKAGVAVIGKDQVAHFRFGAGSVTSIPMDVSSYRSFFAFNNVADKDIALISMEDNFLAVDITSDKLLWQTQSPEELDDGYAHRLLKLQGENAIFSFAVSSMGKRNQLKVVSLNLMTGKINYAHLVAKSDNYIPGISRTLGQWTVAISGPQGKAANSTGRGQRIMNPGWDNIGITYDHFEYNGKVVVALHTKASMNNPETGDRGGEGFFAFDPATGAIAYKDYFRCADEGKGGLEPKLIAPQGNVVSNGKGIVFMPGEESIVAFDLNAGKRLWTQDKLDAKPTSLALIEGTLYVQLGTQDYDVVLQKNDIKFEKYNDDDPYGFAAIDPASGTVIWKIDMEQTMGINMPDFSIMNYYNPKTNQLYFSDEEKLYALKLTRESKGKFDWVIDLDKSKIGEMPYTETYAVTETFIGTKPRTHTSSTYIGGGWTIESTTTYGGVDPEKQMEYLDETGSAELSTVYTSFWGNIWGVSARRCLRVVAADGKILALGTKGMALLDAASGKSFWDREWDYDQEEVQYVPRIIGNKIVYCVNRQLTCADLTSGKASWQVEEGKKAKYFISPDDRFLFSINEEKISGYDLR